MGYDQSIPLKRSGVTDVCYIAMWVWTLEQQNLDGRGEHKIIASPTGDGFVFIAPNEIQENHRHNWQPFDTITGRAGQAMASFTNNVRQVGGIASGTISPKKTRADTPLVYVDSDRRQFTFTIRFLDQEKPDEITDCVDQIRKYAAANSSSGDGGGGLVSQVYFPNIFELYTYPRNFINIRYAALTDFQTTYSYPFMGGGNPSDISMTLTFCDLEPLFKNSFNSTATISTSVG